MNSEPASGEWRIFGPPGTGKTTYLSRQVARAAEVYGPKSLLVTSFTRTAAREMAGRELPIEQDQVGTVHSHCWRALGRPVLAETRLKDWNEENPDLRITGKKADIDQSAVEDTSGQECPGDALLQQMGNFRAHMTPREAWPLSIQRFAERWDGWKASAGLFDFTDLLETAYRDVAVAPGAPSVLVVDEAQDMSRLQLSLIRSWGRYCDYFLVAGDDDQAIFAWSGATPDALLSPELPPEQVRVLKQSWRLPVAIHAAAQGLAGQITRRQSKEYLPRESPGLVRSMEIASADSPEAMVRDLKTKVEEGYTCMVLAACGYLLDRTIACLREAGIPFGNPWRPENGNWNPFGSSGKSAAARLSSLLTGAGRGWTMEELHAWTEWLPVAGLLRRGVRDQIKTLAQAEPGRAMTPEESRMWFDDAAFGGLFDAEDLSSQEAWCRWWLARMPQSHIRSATFAARVAEAWGVEALTTPPYVTVGTIHSVKGGEADVVYLVPDLSPQWMEQWQSGGERKDDVLRLLYVGVTRAKEELVILGGSRRGMSVPLIGR